MIATSLVLALGCASAPAAADFAWQWPVEPAEAGAMHRIDLDAGVYAQVTRADLGDLVALNAAGAEIAFGPVPVVAPTRTPRPPARADVPWFVVPRPPQPDAADVLELHVVRDSNGRLRSLDTRIGGADGNVGSDILLDLGSDPDPVTTIEIALADDSADLRVGVDVFAGSDLRRWNRIATGLPLLSLRQAAFRLEHLRLELAATRAPYLLLAPQGAAAPLPLRAITAVRRSGGEPVETPRASARAAPVAAQAGPGTFEYRSPGPMPVDRIVVGTQVANAVARVTVESRDDDKLPWRERARFLMFRLTDAGGTAVNPATSVGQSRDRQWRISTEPALAAAPDLLVEFTPESYVLLAQGPGPYRVAAGSATAARTTWPIADLLAPLRAQWGSTWQPPRARLGAGSALAGANALRAPPKPRPWRQWGLWAVLVGGALAIVVMVVRLVRAPQG